MAKGQTPIRSPKKPAMTDDKRVAAASLPRLSVSFGKRDKGVFPDDPKKK